MLANALGRDGLEVTVANDGLAALEVRRAHEVDVILCDLRMPRLDGVGLLRRLAVARQGLQGADRDRCRMAHVEQRQATIAQAGESIINL